MKKKFLSMVIAMCMLGIFATNASAATNINIGDYIQMGSYYGEPILWRCVDIDENGPLILSDKIICLKPFDAEASANTTTGSHSLGDRGDFGSNYWADSNMRSWLNSTASAGNVNWLCGNPPSEDYVWLGYNDYVGESGFLTNFSQGETNAMKSVSQKSLVSYPEYNNGIYTMGSERYEWNSNIADVMTDYDKSYAEYVTDKMFLMDVKQVNAVYNNRAILGEDYYIGVPTAQAVANSEYKEDGYLEAGKKWFYWLRSPHTANSYTTRCVHNNGCVYDGTAYDGYYGVRPAFYLSDTAVLSGAGTNSAPYIVLEPKLKVEYNTKETAITNDLDFSIEAEVIIAKYENGALKDISSKKTTFEAGETKNYDLSGGDYKVFVWNSLLGMYPLNK